ncbi:hypothetical protein [Klebsiella pneumoniae IS53]|nr:hypothetical protein [Klebsiella pneumoniae IS53]
MWFAWRRSAILFILKPDASVWYYAKKDLALIELEAVAQ